VDTTRRINRLQQRLDELEALLPSTNAAFTDWFERTVTTVSQVLPEDHRAQNRITTANWSPMVYRRSSYVVVMVGALASLVVIYESTPAKGAKHDFNGPLVVVCLVIFLLFLGAFLFDSRLAHLYARITRNAPPQASHEGTPDGVVLKLVLRDLDCSQVFCRLRYPTGEWQQIGPMVDWGSREAETEFPARFQENDAPTLPTKGTYRVRWTVTIPPSETHEVARDKFRYTPP
jgi:hypothetical protein